MTLAPHRSPLPSSDLEGVAAAIRASGGRLSSACRVVLAALSVADGPVSAEYLAEGLGGRTIGLEISSVYRNLERLEELGVVRHVHVGHGPGLYMLEGDTQREYLVCERCDRVDTVDAARLDPVRAEIRKTFGYEARFSHFPIVALCERCARLGATGGEGGGTTGESRRRGKAGRHEHDPVEDQYQHSHGDYVHTHEHVHEPSLEEDHGHGH